MPKDCTNWFPCELRARLRTKFLGRGTIAYYASTGSTQDLAIKAAVSGENANGVVIIAEKQTSGRGRSTRKWISPPGGLWMSVILDPKLTLRDFALLPLVGAIACSTAILDCTGLMTSLKWPNDVLLHGRKVAGILGDMALENEEVKYAVLGIGINANLNSRQVRMVARQGNTEGISALSIELGSKVDRVSLAAEVLNSLEFFYQLLAKSGGAAIIKEWKKHSDMLGRRVVILRGTNRIDGKAIDVREDGNLMIRSEKSQIVAISSGDVRVFVGE